MAIPCDSPDRLVRTKIPGNPGPPEPRASKRAASSIPPHRRNVEGAPPESTGPPVFPDLLNRREAAKYLRLQTSTLDKWRCERRHLSFIRAGGKILFVRLAGRTQVDVRVDETGKGNHATTSSVT